MPDGLCDQVFKVTAFFRWHQKPPGDGERLVADGKMGRDQVNGRFRQRPNSKDDRKPTERNFMAFQFDFFR
jgi:hypothetical protein